MRQACNLGGSDNVTRKYFPLADFILPFNQFKVHFNNKKKMFTILHVDLFQINATNRSNVSSLRVFFPSCSKISAQRDLRAIVTCIVHRDCLCGMKKSHGCNFFAPVHRRFETGQVYVSSAIGRSTC